MDVYFSDYFNINPSIIDKYGAFNISLVNDIPLFVDPFLLFNSTTDEYRCLHDEIIKYVSFLREMSESGELSNGLIKSWFLFPEVKQNWLGYSMVGNGGAGLGVKFAKALNRNLNNIFNNFGKEEVTKGSHLEKLCLISGDVGKDSISDFTVNLIKGFLCEYTQTFAVANINNALLKKVNIKHAFFNYETRSWCSKIYTLPYIDGDFVLLTPKDMLTKDEAWINKHDIFNDFDDIASSIPNEELKAQVNQYLLRRIPEAATKKEIDGAKSETILEFPFLIDYYIRHKEENGDQAQRISEDKLSESQTMFVAHVETLMHILKSNSTFYNAHDNTFEEAYSRVSFLKQVIENNDGYRIFYIKGKPVKRESDLQLMFRLTWYATIDDVNSEVNNGRGSVDYKISRGKNDTTLVEFKLASNTKLKQNLAKQVSVYEAANQTKQSIKVVLFFSEEELTKLFLIMKELDIRENKNFVIIDARADNKISASNVK